MSGAARSYSPCWIPQTQLSQAESDLLFQSIACRRNSIAFHLPVGDLVNRSGHHIGLTTSFALVLPPAPGHGELQAKPGSHDMVECI
jgi:hypothetical protein